MDKILGKGKYIQRIQKCELTTLKFHRHKGDMIETYKILSCKYDLDASPNFNLNVTTSRGNHFKLMKERSKYDLRKFTFINRVNNIWNSLPNSIIMSLTTNQFKNSLDKFWINQAVRYNYVAELSGIGSRSED